MTELFAIIASIILAALSVFQIMLICGLPIGRFAWGGNHNVLPMQLRLGSVLSILLYAVFAIFILSKAGIITILPDSSFLQISMWVFTGYFTIGIAMNAISRSKSERILMTPVATALAISFLIVSIT